MPKEINIIFDEETGRYAVDLSGYEGNKCLDELRKLMRNLRAEGVDAEVTSSKKKPPQIPLMPKSKTKAKIGG